MQADSIKIECEEDGFHLVIDGNDPTGEYQAAEFNFNIHSCAEALHEQVNLIIGGWLAEGARARMEPPWVETPRLDTDGGGYALDDPKHPDYHSVHADIWDAREGK